MKKHFLPFMKLVVLVFVIAGCKKESTSSTTRNTPPKANAGSDIQVILPANSCILTGSAQDDENNVDVTLWKMVSGPASSYIENPGLLSTAVNDLVPGVYQFELTVKDKGGLSAKDTMQVIVNPAGTTNQPPVANAGPDQSIHLPLNSINLDGSGSSDPDNNISSYQWTKISGPSSFTIVTPTAVQTNLTNLVEGIYMFELKATDNGGLTDKDTMQVIVNPVVIANHPPVAKAGPDRSINLPVNNITLNGSASSDPENNISSYQWAKIAGPSAFTIQAPAAAQTTVTNLVAGLYEFELKVTDAGGLWSKDTVKVTVTVNGNTQELIFNNLLWIPIWYETLEIRDFYSYIPANTPFKVYIQRDFNPAWIEVIPVNTSNGSNGNYEYFIETRPDGGGMYQYGSLYIYYNGSHVSDTPAVKIIF